MTTRKRIPQITLPGIDETSHFILGSTILFIHLAYDDSPHDPTEDEGVGKIDVIDSRHMKGTSRDSAVASLFADFDDAVPLRYTDYGQCKWSVYDDHQAVLESIMTERLKRRLRGENPDDWGTVNFEPDWFEKIDGIWIPDNCVRESYNEQDGLTRREWMVKQAEAVCETYTDYCNGTVYGYHIELHSARRDDDGEVITEHDYYKHHKALEEDSCWGFYGEEYIKDEVIGVVKSILKDQKYSRRAITEATKEAA